jgi:1-aminocyclopropane-1-carboxylate deaminase
MTNATTMIPNTLQLNGDPLQIGIEHLPVYQGVNLQLLRLDALDPEISGNKWFKLRHNLNQAREQKHKRVLSFGGCYSNHLHALAAAGQRFGFDTVGIIRGEEPKQYSPTLHDLRRFGMHMKFVSRTQYRQKTSAEFLVQLNEDFGDFYLIPEGGSNALGVLGCEDIVASVWAHQTVRPNYIVLACGTGATMAGVISGTAGRAYVIGVAALKGAQFLEKNVLDLLEEKFSVNKSRLQKEIPLSKDNNDHPYWHIEYDYSFGGFAKISPILTQFMLRFRQETGVLLDPVYTGKMMFAVYDMIARKVIPSGANVLAIHTGGLQGLRGIHIP